MFLSKLFGDPVKRLLEKHKLTVDEINKLEPKFEVFSFEELRGASQKLKERFGGNQPKERWAKGITTSSLSAVLFCIRAKSPK
ncbi:MAG: Protein translocase subunit SecA [Candidatus Azambacteria bacterium GW2011_GWB1_46_27]|uniref:Protein translocase subunit SecA n=1 Tax=Candidatus Azambacteria bacterium GW2011_GWB1_46_27 TaxID=1618617 RepID=A0A0G1SQP1_9BACT|nr:MAG: Protein translocase subunit SecA [Candidatus Azambacteria bacterium GW2011_GWB1_46_27]